MNIPTGFAQVNFMFTGTAVPTGAECTFGVNQDFGMGPADVALAVDTAIVAGDIIDMWASTCTLATIHVKIGPNATGPAFDRSVGYAGTASGTAGYAGVSALVTKATALGGRKGKGRMFIPAITESDVVTGGLLDGTFRTASQGKLDAFLAALTSELVPMVLLHNSPGDSPDVVTDLNLEAQTATQRRRNRR